LWKIGKFYEGLRGIGELGKSAESSVNREGNCLSPARIFFVALDRGKKIDSTKRFGLEWGSLRSADNTEKMAECMGSVFII
jgi:hypothetical protein